MTKKNVSDIQEHISIIKAGVMWMIMNVENGYPPNGGVLKHMREINKTNCKEKHKVVAYYNFVKDSYAKDGLEGLHNLLGHSNIPKIL